MKSFAMKASMSEMVSPGEGDERVRVKIFMARGCRPNVLVIKEEVGFGGKAQERRLVFGTLV